jgi:plastocyanin
MKPSALAGVIIAVLIVGGIIAYASYTAGNKDAYVPPPTEEGNQVVCTMEAKQCPDGSYVGRSGPNCAFAACPSMGATTTTTNNTTVIIQGGVNLGAVRVSYTDSGFSPRDITVAKGQTVTFVNNSTHDMWPASDDHPTHTIYPEFDPKRRIAAGDSFSFVFEKVGTWEYHNHLQSSQTGSVTVK